MDAARTSNEWLLGRNSRRFFSFPEVCERCSNLEFPTIPLPTVFRYLESPNLNLDTLTRTLGSEYMRNRHLELIANLGPYSLLLRDDTCPLCQLLVSTVTSSYQTSSHDNDIPAGDLSLYAFSNATLFSDLSDFPGGEIEGFRTRGETFYTVIPDNSFPDNEDDLVYKVPSSLGHLEIIRNIMPRGWISRGRSTKARTQDFGARVIDADHLNIDLVRSWIETCRFQHGAACGESQPDFKGMVPFKVIDCQTRTLIRAPWGCQYVAFSYVWGHATAATDGGKLPQDTPQSIQDAIELAQKIGFKYLWVDRYCITQDSPNEKHAQIHQMNLIYRNAQLTIIAAAGTNPFYGLPGISTPRRYRQPVAKQQHEKVTLTTTFPDAAAMIKDSRWLTRAWTYQEALLSRRCLVITDFQAYFECADMHCYEAVNTPQCKWVKNMQYGTCSCRRSSIFSFADVYPNSLGAWKLIVEYSNRQLTHQEDILDGISGVFREFQFLNQPFYFHWGIPISGKQSAYGRRASRTIDMTSRFATALCWRHNVPMKRRAGFPSWSWTGWVGAVSGWIGSVDFQSFLPVMVKSHPKTPITFGIENSAGTSQDIAQYLIATKTSTSGSPASQIIRIDASVIALTLHTASTYQGPTPQIEDGEVWAKLTVSPSHYIWLPVDVTASNLALLDLYNSKFDGVVLGPTSKEDGFSRDIPPTAVMITKMIGRVSERVGFVVIRYPIKEWCDTKGHFRRDSHGVERFCKPSEKLVKDFSEIAMERKVIRLA